jgi:drug/metabolite transporter (DMT)-like permease
MTRTRGTAALAAVGLWSTNAYAADAALTQLSVFQLLTLQYGAATLILVAGCILWSEQSSLDFRQVGIQSLAIGVVGLTGTIFLQYLAFAAAPIVAANVIAYGWPLMAAIWVAVTRRTRQARRGVVLALFGFGGVALIFGSDGIQLDGAALGYLAALGSAACMAFFTVASGRRAASTVQLLVPATIVGTVTAGMATLVQAEPWPPVTAWPAAIYVGVGPMAIGYGLWTYAMSAGGAERLSPIGYATPLLSTGLLMIAGRPFGALTVVGAALILICSVGVLANDRKPREARPPGVSLGKRLQVGARDQRERRRAQVR